MRRKTVPCSVRTRSAALSRRTMRAGGALAEIARASVIGAAAVVAQCAR